MLGCYDISMGIMYLSSIFVIRYLIIINQNFYLI